MSAQQSRYLTARASGATMMTACVTSGVPVEEARLIEAAVARGELSFTAAEDAVQQGEVTVADQKQQESIEVVKPDFERAVRIFRHDIKPAVKAAGERGQEASTAYKEIKDKCHVNTRAAKFVFKLAGESEEKRNDILRSVRGLLGAMGIGITDDLVSDAEGEDNEAPIVPRAAPEPAGLATLN